MKSKIKNFQTKKEVKILSTHQKSKVSGGTGPYRTRAATNGD